LTYQLCLGQAVSVPQAPTEGLLRIYDHKRAFIGIGTILDDGRVAPKRLLKTGNKE
jgi:tRNA pseudouridine55 synthase